MSSLGNHINSTPTTLHADFGGPLYFNGIHARSQRSRTPISYSQTLNASQSANAPEAEPAAEDDPRVALFKSLYAQSEGRLDALFDVQEKEEAGVQNTSGDGPRRHDEEAEGGSKDKEIAPQKKAARAIEEDDYDDSEEDDEDAAPNVSPLKAKSTGAPVIPRIPSPAKVLGAPPSPKLPGVSGTPSQWQAKSSDDVRKRLEEDKKAAEDAAKRSFHTLFYTVDNDRDAMLEQQKLEEADRQVDVEMSGNNAGTPNPNSAVSGQAQQGSLSQANLGASSLTLKHLIARIDAKRDAVVASDQDLRNLMSEVRKNRSKWASEERVGQEELYEAAEKVLSELKAMTEHSHAFLTKVNKREAPDYYNVIKHPMDLGSMTKKLKAVQYKSKQEFVDDLNLIWANCLKYNANPEHFLRRHALFMRKETEKLVPLIPEIVIRDRADVEAEERRLHSAEGDIDGGEDSDDEPIISSRGRKAPGKKAKKGSNARKAPPGGLEGTPGVETKPSMNSLGLNGNDVKYRNDFLRADSDTAMEDSQNGLSTPPPPGTLTPAGVNGNIGSGAPGSQVDPMEIDGGASVNGNGHSLSAHGGVADHDDLEYKTWKQVTKKDRALVAAERHRLFKGDHINPEEPALLRSKAGMRRWTRKNREADAESILGKRKRESEAVEGEDTGPSGETLAEGMEGEEERVLPDYYDTMAAIPELSADLQWVEDSEGHVVPGSGEFLRMLPKGLFTSTESAMTKRMGDNMQQMQETRKICQKIGVVKQMQLQSQMYQNQFQRYDPEPFTEKDIDSHVIFDEGPVMSHWVARAALQRSVGEIFYHAGFEEFQPSALDAITDIASDFFDKIGRTLSEYMEAPKTATVVSVPGSTEPTVTWKSNFSTEETILHCLQENGMDVESLESYVKDDVERASGKLSVMHDRMKAHLADLLRPALTDAGPDGVNAFNDGSEQFVGGDFAEDLDEDFFGFKDLGLDKEFGLTSLSVPLHLLQNRMHSAYQAQNTNATSTAPSSLPTPPPYPPVTIHSLPQEIGLVHNFFFAKLHANKDEPLVEDEDLPQKQRFPKPRLPPTGKISSPRKKPVREPGPGKGHPRKKMKLNAEGEEPSATNGAGNLMNGVLKDGKEKGGGGGIAKPVGKLRLGATTAPPLLERSESRDAEGDSLGISGDIGKENAKGKKVQINGDSESGNGGMMSPESLEAT